MPTEVLKNNIQTTLLAAIDSNDAVITPTDPTGFPATGEQARACIGDELLIVTGGDGPQYDVVRGAEGTTAVGHVEGEAVRLVLTAAGFSALAAQEAADVLAVVAELGANEGVAAAASESGTDQLATFNAQVNDGDGIASAEVLACDRSGDVTSLAVTGPGVRVDGVMGASGTFTSADGKTITVTKGLITEVV